MARIFISMFTLFLILIIFSICYEINAASEVNRDSISEKEKNTIYERTSTVVAKILESTSEDLGIAEQPTLLRKDLSEAPIPGDGTCLSEWKPEPRAQFTCSSGRLICESAIIAEEVIIPQTQTIFRSSLTVLNSLSLIGKKSKIEVLECFSVSPTTTVTFTLSSLELDIFHYQGFSQKDKVLLITQQGQKCPPIPKIKITAIQLPDSCKDFSISVNQDDNNVYAQIKVGHRSCLPGTWIFPLVFTSLAIVALVFIIILQCTAYGRKLLK